MMEKQILIIEDEKPIAEILAYLHGRSYYL